MALHPVYKLAYQISLILKILKKTLFFKLFFMVVSVAMPNS